MCIYMNEVFSVEIIRVHIDQIIPKALILSCGLMIVRFHFNLYQRRIISSARPTRQQQILVGDKKDVTGIKKKKRHP